MASSTPRTAELETVDAELEGQLRYAFPNVAMPTAADSTTIGPSAVTAMRNHVGRAIAGGGTVVRIGPTAALHAVALRAQ